MHINEQLESMLHIWWLSKSSKNQPLEHLWPFRLLFHGSNVLHPDSPNLGLIGHVLSIIKHRSLHFLDSEPTRVFLRPTKHFTIHKLRRALLFHEAILLCFRFCHDRYSCQFILTIYIFYLRKIDSSSPFKSRDVGTWILPFQTNSF